MSEIVCSVVCINRRWFADCGNTRHGPYTSVDTATRVAISEARMLSGKNRAVKVAIHDADGRVTAEISVRPDTKPARKPHR
jgi:hypothetical protein